MSGKMEDEVRKMESAIKALEPGELIDSLKNANLSIRGNMETLINRLTRFELRNRLKINNVRWDPGVDERQTPPLLQIGQEEENNRQISARLTSPFPSLEISRDLTNVTSRSIPNPAHLTVSAITSTTATVVTTTATINPHIPPPPVSYQLLPTGQSVGPFRDPMTLDAEDMELTELMSSMEINPTPRQSQGHSRSAPTVRFSDIIDQFHLSPHPPPANIQPSPLPYNTATPVNPNIRPQYASSCICEQPEHIPVQINVPRLPQISQLSRPTFIPVQPQPTQIPRPPTITPQPRSFNPYITHIIPESEHSQTNPDHQISQTNPYNPSYYGARSSTLAEPRQDKAGQAFHHWGLKFSGGSVGDAIEFLTRLAECCSQRGLREQEALQALPMVFTGMALKWYRVRNREWRTFGDFERDFKEYFEIDDIQEEITREIEKRTQGPGEPIKEYMTNMEILFSYLDPVPDQKTQVDIVYRQLHPEYRREIRKDKIKSLIDIQKLGRAFEKEKALSKKYKPPPPAHETLCPHTAFNKPPEKRDRMAVIKPPKNNDPIITFPDSPPPTRKTYSQTLQSPTHTPDAKASQKASEPCSEPSQGGPRQRPCPPAVNKQPSRPVPVPLMSRVVPKPKNFSNTVPPPDGPPARGPSAPGSGPESVCWRCGQKGHWSRECPQRRGRCTGCGGDGIVYPSCARCGKKHSGNAKREA